MANVGVVPSLFEPFGYVPVEMMMHGLPVVATATSGLDEVVDDSCGLKVPLAVSADQVEIDADRLAERSSFATEFQRGRAVWSEWTQAICGEIFLEGVRQEYVGVL